MPGQSGCRPWPFFQTSPAANPNSAHKPGIARHETNKNRGKPKISFFHSFSPSTTCKKHILLLQALLSHRANPPLLARFTERKPLFCTAHLHHKQENQQAAPIPKLMELYTHCAGETSPEQKTTIFSHSAQCTQSTNLPRIYLLLAHAITHARLSCIRAPRNTSPTRNYTYQ